MTSIQHKNNYHKRSLIITFIVLGIICIAAVIGRLLISSGLNLPITDDEKMRSIINIRCISVVTAILAGICLSTSGVYLQTLLRNPLASPYILGLAGGAGLGVATANLIIRLLATANVTDIENKTHWWSQNTGAFVGSLAVLCLVYLLSRKNGLIDPVSLLLVGIMISMACGALIMLIEHFSPASDTDTLIRWMMGNISQLTNWSSLAVVAIITLIGTTAGMFMAQGLDAASLSDDEAISVGVPIHFIRIILFVMAGLMTSAAVVLCGPIGFVGLVSPHIARLLVGSTHYVLIPASAIIASILLLTADIAVRFINIIIISYPWGGTGGVNGGGVTAASGSHGLLPIGILTSLIGGPLFIILLRASRNNTSHGAAGDRGDGSDI